MLKDISHPYSCFRHLRLASLKLFRLGFDVKTLVDSSQEGNLYFLKNYFVILWKIIVILLFFSFKTCAAIDAVAPKFHKMSWAPSERNFNNFTVAPHLTMERKWCWCWWQNCIHERRRSLWEKRIVIQCKFSRLPQISLENFSPHKFSFIISAEL